MLWLSVVRIVTTQKLVEVHGITHSSVVAATMMMMVRNGVMNVVWSRNAVLVLQPTPHSCFLLALHASGHLLHLTSLDTASSYCFGLDRRCESPASVSQVLASQDLHFYDWSCLCGTLGILWYSIAMSLGYYLLL